MQTPRSAGLSRGGSGNLRLVVEPSIPALLRECTSLQPDATAFTVIDYEQDWAGIAESLTWMQLYRRTLTVANELRHLGSPGDRAVILAPQGLGYIIAFFGALQAGYIAVPLSVPLGGVSDERVNSVLRDALPSVALTTSSVAGQVTEYVRTHSGAPVPAVVAVDSLDPSSVAPYGAERQDYSTTAYLQYTSGSTRQPAGVAVSHGNVLANFQQMMADYLGASRTLDPTCTTVVSWLPFYHDMGLYLGVLFPVLGGFRSVVMSPVAFLQRPARWLQLMATNGAAISAAPNFAFELAARKTTDEDIAGLDLGEVHTILSGSERVQPATLKRFHQRFASYNLPDTAVRPSYGLAEATVYAATRAPGQPAEIVHFESEMLTAGRAKRCAPGSGTPLVSYGVPRSPMIRVVDADTSLECDAGFVGEIWVHGDNVATEYWAKPEESERTFGARLVAPSAGTPEGPWLRTGDSGFVCDEELFIIGRIKDLLIVYGRNHSPDDIEATIQEITPTRCAAIAIPDEGTEKLVVIIEFKQDSRSDEGAFHRLSLVKREVTSAISTSHSLSVADLVFVRPGSIPTTSGKVRRSACAEKYRQDQFDRLDL